MLHDEFIIFGENIEKGQGAVLELEVAKLHTSNSIKIPILVERAKQDGPTLLLMAGVHGDETNGVAIVRDIIKKKYNKPDRGTIICIPVFNIFGYLNHTREFPDGRDLNRMFPGSVNGALASQFAYKFTHEIAPLADYIIDFHTGGADRENFPHVRCVLEDAESFSLAKAFNAPFIFNSNYIPKSLRDTVHKMGKTILLFEGGKSKTLDESVIECGVKGAVNVMKSLGIRDVNKEEVLSVENEKNRSLVIEKSKWIRASFSGMLRLEVKNGSWVTKKTVLARISDPFGEFEKKVIAPFDCFIVCVNTTPIVNKGDALFHVSVDMNSRCVRKTNKTV